jgi:EAL domain-containing protein (putative c-di-GMP-specific phosphodiesterase class I)
MFPSDADNARDLIQCSDKAMRRAKRRGASGWERYDGDVDSSLDVLELAEDLRRALDQGQVEVHYQPIFSGSDGSLVGAEALARWNHPLRGAVPPAVFVPVAESMGLIDRLGRHSLHEACKQTAHWSPKLPASFRMSVNVSARQLLFPLQRHLREALEANQCEPGRLEIEMTETALLVANPDLAQRLDEIRELGVGIVLDDFGTGYSSLSFLKQFPIRKVKIDRGFVAGLPFETRDVGISRAIIAMAHTLGLTVVAEGVENEAQQEFLCSYACDALQGYLFGKAVPAAEFEARWLPDAAS